MDLSINYEMMSKKLSALGVKFDGTAGVCSRREQRETGDTKRRHTHERCILLRRGK